MADRYYYYSEGSRVGNLDYKRFFLAKISDRSPVVLTDLMYAGFKAGFKWGPSAPVSGWGSKLKAPRTEKDIEEIVKDKAPKGFHDKYKRFTLPAIFEEEKR